MPLILCVLETGFGSAVELYAFSHQGPSPHLRSSAHPRGDSDHRTWGLSSDSVGIPTEKVSPSRALEL